MKPTVRITVKKAAKFLVAVCLATGAAAFGVAMSKKKRSAKIWKNQNS